MVDKGDHDTITGVLTQAKQEEKAPAREHRREERIRAV